MAILALDGFAGSMTERAGAKITEVYGSHLIMVSQPQAVTEVILEAAGAPTPQEGKAWANALVEAYLEE
jgi:hypothetical protein